MNPKYYDAPAQIYDDVRLSRRYFTYRIGEELAAGKLASVQFTLDRPAKEVWPYFKDFNLWQNSRDHYYSGVLGDLEGRTFRLSKTPHEPGPHQYKVAKVIPEHLIVIDQPGPWDGGPQPYDGYSVFMLDDQDGKTLLSILMQHSIRTNDQTEEQALNYWRQMESALTGKWRDAFIPTLKKLVCQ